MYSRLLGFQHDCLPVRAVRGVLHSPDGRLCWLWVFCDVLVISPPASHGGCRNHLGANADAGPGVLGSGAFPDLNAHSRSRLPATSVATNKINAQRTITTQLTTTLRPWPTIWYSHCSRKTRTLAGNPRCAIEMFFLSRFWISPYL